MSSMFDPLESSVAFLIETSSVTAPFLGSIRDNLGQLFHNKSLVLNSSYGLRFNIGYFSRETSLWDDESVPFSMETGLAAMKWMKEWPVTDFCFTPRGRASQHSGPHVIPALVAAFTDSSIRSVYLIAGSAPFQGTNDIINHLGVASKDRNVHVIFVTGQRNVDFKAMEILHIISKETRGTFRVAYFDAFGQLLQVLKAEDNRMSMSSLHPDSTLSPNQLALVPASYGTSGFLAYPAQKETGVRIQDLLSGSFKQQSKAGSFDDIKIPLPQSMSKRRTEQSFHAIPAPLTVGHMFEPQHLSFPSEDDSWIRFKQKLEKEETSINDHQMNEIRRMFSKLYADKKKKEHKRKSYKSVKAKVYKFKSPRRDRKRSTSSSSDDGSTNSSTPDSDIDSILKDVRTLKIESRRRRQSLSGEGAASSIQGSHRPWSSRSFRSGTVASKGKSAWKHPGTVSTGFVSQRPTVTTDRSQAWMDPWQNAMLKKQNEVIPGKQTKGIQIGPGTVSSTFNRRPQLSNARIHGNFRSYDERSASPQSDLQIDTIRELVKTNNNLVKALDRKQTTTEEQRRIEQNRSKVFSKIKAAQANSRARIPSAAELAAKKQEVLGELRDLAITNRNLGAVNQRQRLNNIREQEQYLNSLRQDRQQQIQKTLERKEEIRQQRQQQNYKAMYEKLVGDITSRGPSSGGMHVTSGTNTFEKPIAIIPQ